MAKIKEHKTITVSITEQSIRELLIAIEKSKKDGEVPDIIKVSSTYSNVQFEIFLETKPNTQESIGYRLGDSIFKLNQ